MNDVFNGRSKSQRQAEKKYDEKRKGWRARAWTCVVYLESAPDNWKELLHDLGVSYDISPLHDKDLNEEGELKKPHHHVVIDAGPSALFSGDQAIEMFKAFGGVFPDADKNKNLFLKKCKVRRIDRALRYLCHLDEHDPSKHVYDIEDVISGYQDLPYSERILTEGEKDELILQMCDLCESNDVLDFATFFARVRIDHPEWVHSLIHGDAGRFMHRYLNGRQARNREEREKKKYLLAKWRYEKETGLPTPESVLGRRNEK